MTCAWGSVCLEGNTDKYQLLSSLWVFFLTLILLIDRGLFVCLLYQDSEILRDRTFFFQCFKWKPGST